MELDFFGLININLLYILIGMVAVTLISIILAIVAIVKSSNMKKKYNMMMEGFDGQSIEKTVNDYTHQMHDLIEESKKHTLAIKDIYGKMQYTFQKIGMLKYDAFHEMGGKLSFALCMLDKQNNGFLMNVMHGSTGSFAYIKEIVDGKSYIDLGDEEQQALEMAIAGKMGDESLSPEVNEKIQADVM